MAAPVLFRRAPGPAGAVRARRSQNAADPPGVSPSGSVSAATAARTGRRQAPAGLVARERRRLGVVSELEGPETVRDHGSWGSLRGEAVRRNTIVASGPPDDFLALPSRANRGVEARRQPRELRVQHAPGHRKRADGARAQVADLIDAGLLTPGERLTGRSRATTTSP